ncbi:MAG: hypothetical protein WBP55_00745 [Solirubrobacterales bacterium]
MLSNIAIQPTLKLQCIVFMIGSTLFAVGASPVLSDALGTHLSNVIFFIGAWFFSTAAFVQLQLAGSARNERGALKAVWLAASTQFLGTLLFLVSTGAAIDATAYVTERDFVWVPNAEGSAAFLISGAFVLLVLVRAKSLWGPVNRDWISSWVNMIGCVAFGAAVFGAVVLPGGGDANAELATWGTFIGAICFFIASAVVLPDAGKKEGSPVPETGLANETA